MWTGEWGNWGATVGLHQVKLCSSSSFYIVIIIIIIIIIVIIVIVIKEESALSFYYCIILYEDSSSSSSSLFSSSSPNYHRDHKESSINMYPCCYRPGQGAHIRKGPTQKGTSGAEVGSITIMILQNQDICIIIFQWWPRAAFATQTCWSKLTWQSWRKLSVDSSIVLTKTSWKCETKNITLLAL